MVDKFIAQIEEDFPQFKFRVGRKFTFRPPSTIILEQDKTLKNYKMLALHEVGHALLEHRDYRTDLERVRMERDAWEEARRLAVNYGVEFDEEVVEDELDTYREWLHQKSRCPECGLTRFETPDGIYHCPRCENFCSLPVAN